MAGTKIVKVNPSKPEEKFLRKAADIIRDGGLVIIPTETVYGIAANSADKKAIERLYEIKKRPQQKHFSIHIDSKDKLNDFARRVPVAAYKLIDAFWPGPLTIVLESTGGSTVGIRMPDDPIAQRVIHLSDVPVVCPSANISGEKPPVNFEQAIKDLNGLVDYAVDAGSTRLGIESTVVDLTVEPLKVLRESAIKKDIIEQAVSKKTVLFICTGNSCRSVMAQALLQKKLKEMNRTDVEVISAGTMLVEGLGASFETKELLLQEGMDVSSHRSKHLTKDLINKSDLILAMEYQHEQYVLNLAPEVKNRLFLLKEFVKQSDNSLNIADPIGRSKEFYASTFEMIRQAVQKISEII